MMIIIIKQEWQSKTLIQFINKFLALNMIFQVLEGKLANKSFWQDFKL